MTRYSKHQGLVDTAVGVRKLNVEYVDRVAECHKLPRGPHRWRVLSSGTSSLAIFQTQHVTDGLRCAARPGPGLQIPGARPERARWRLRKHFRAEAALLAPVPGERAHRHRCRP